MQVATMQNGKNWCDIEKICWKEYEQLFFRQDSAGQYAFKHASDAQTKYCKFANYIEQVGKWCVLVLGIANGTKSKFS